MNGSFWSVGIAAQQDYLWFLCIVAWLAAVMIWWRLGCSDHAYRWLPVSAAISVAVAATEWSALVIHVTEAPNQPSRLVWDVGLGGLSALQLIAWCWVATMQWPRGRRLATVVSLSLLALVAAALRLPYPGPASLLLAISLLAAAGALWQGWRGRAVPTCSTLLIAAATWVSSSGPLAVWLNQPRRFSELNPMGPGAAALLLSAGLIVIYDLGRSALRGSSLQDSGLKQGLQMARWLGVWLVAGLGLTWMMSASARQQFENNTLSRMRMAASLIDTAALERLLGPELQLGARADIRNRADGRIVPQVHTSLVVPPQDPRQRAPLNPRLAPQLLSVMGALTKIEVANLPEVKWPLFLTLRGDYLLALCHSGEGPNGRRMRIDPVNIQSFATAETRIAWANREAALVGPAFSHYGAIVQGRVPLVTATKRMLGWLSFDFSPSRWVVQQAQVRLLAFAVVGVGAGLIVSFGLQRLHQRQHEQARREVLVAAESNRAKTAFLAKVSHELRTPIQSILGYSELMASLTLEQEHRRWLHAVRSQSQLLIRLVNDLIDLSAIQAGAFRLSLKPANLAELVRSVSDSLLPRAQAKRLDLACEIDPRVAPWLLFDVERARQVLFNLLGNAIKFTSRGGIRVRLNLLKADTASNTLALEFRDTGPGIAPEDQRRLFLPFSRLETSSPVEGAGLGLALSAAICESMGGDLRIESDGVNGSTFIARFRLETTPPPPPPAADAAVVSLVGRRILVADDNPLVRELFLAGLRGAGAWCEPAVDGLEAVERCAYERFDVVVLDVSMPWVDGYEATRRIRASSASPLRIIGVSAHASTREREAAVAAGMDAFLVKPVSIAALLNTIAGTSDAAGVRPTAGHDADLALLRRLRHQFYEEGDRVRSELRQSFASGDRRWLRTRVHYLKNSADVAGYPELSLLCGDLERLLSDGAIPPAPSDELARRLAEIDRLMHGFSKPPPAPGA